MNHCAVQQSAMAAYEEMRRPFVSIVSDRRDPIFCPKPGRLSRFVAAADAIRPLRWHLGPQTEPCDSKPGSEVLDIILTKGAFSDAGEALVGSSPPYFCGSPPSRSTNPVALDARFGEAEAAPPLTLLPTRPPPPRFRAAPPARRQAASALSSAPCPPPSASRASTASTPTATAGAAASPPSPSRRCRCLHITNPGHSPIRLQGREI
ncbi:unnamed protein product [Spirodela intermedia]|uniref:Uncharacterized protein n=1 Tax=Spirodela intermedia TaxID=51605 RepID=A0A7I8IVW6_SPIIN|nr:unnamed protein product [Spirodela intermedia]CAA6661299.1 unnamed protein product [Spirodela intermedia]